jgi:hypothetical protein
MIGIYIGVAMNKRQYKIDYTEDKVIRESIENNSIVSTNYFMRKLRCTFDKAEYIVKEYIGKFIKGENMGQVYQTTNYNLFKTLPGNRPINPQNLNNIIRSVRHSNKLNLHPIIVNEEMCVIDGQHRLAAAIKLSLPVYYMVSQGKDEKEAYEHIMCANINQKKWTIEDYLNLYAKKDQNKNYKEFIDMMAMLELKPRALAGLIFGNHTGNLFDTIKAGEMKMPEDKSQMDKIGNAYLLFRQFTEKRKIKPVSMFTTYHFCSAFRMLLMNESCDTNIFFSKLENRWFELRPQATADDWFKLLIGIYNWKNMNKIEEAA